MVADSGYRPGYVNFSCRIVRSARSRDPPVNIIASLKAAADLNTGNLVKKMGESFARGHKEASGGIVPAAEFEELMTLMKIGEKPDPKPNEVVKKKKAKASPQKHNLLLTGCIVKGRFLRPELEVLRGKCVGRVERSRRARM